MSTSTSNPNAPPYPPNLYHLSSTYGKWCPLRCKDLFLLRNDGVFIDGQPIHHHATSFHPIRCIKTIGVIVAIDEFGRRRIYTLDDGSGACVECVALLPLADTRSVNRNNKDSANKNTNAKEEPEKSKEASTQSPTVPWDEIDTGSVVRLLGTLSSWQGMLQVQVVKMTVVGSTDVERKWWDECRVFREGVLGSKWVVTEEEIKENERVERKERERERRRSEREKEKNKTRVGEKGGMKIRGTSRSNVEVQKRRRKRSRSPSLERERERRERGKENQMENESDRKLSRLLSAATRRSTSTSTSTKNYHPKPPSTTLNSNSNPPYKAPVRRLVPVVLANQGKYDTLGL